MHHGDRPATNEERPLPTARTQQLEPESLHRHILSFVTLSEAKGLAPARWRLSSDERLATDHQHFARSTTCSHELAGQISTVPAM